MSTDAATVAGDLLGALDVPMFVATVDVDGERSGCLVGFGTQCSIDPVRFLVCISRTNHTAPLAARAEVMAVHVLGADQRDLAELFGGETGDEVDKFAGIGWRPGPGGVPIIDGCPGWLAGRVLDRYELGDHTGYLLEPVEAWRAEQVTQLGLQRVGDIEPGHEA